MKKSLSVWTVFCLLLVSVIEPQQVGAFRFDLPVNQQRCFTEEVSSELEVTVSFAAGEGYGQFVDTTVTLVPESGSQEDNRLTLWKVTENKGTFHQRISHGGEVELCFQSRTASGVSLKSTDSRPIFVDFFVGTNPRAYERVATESKMRPIKAQLRQVEGYATDILREYSFYKERETEIGKANGYMSSRIMWAAIIVVLIICFFSYLQVKQIERYLRRKRMID